MAKLSDEAIEAQALELVKSERDQWRDPVAFVTEKVAFNVRDLIRQVRQYFLDGNQFFKPVLTGHLGTIQLCHTADGDFLQQLIFTEFFGFEVFHLLDAISAI